MTTVAYHRTAERPSLEIWWLSDAGALIDFSAGYTFALKLGSQGSAAILTKTSGIVGAVGAGTEPGGTPNVLVTWSAGELDIAPGTYLAQLTATTGGLDRVKTFSFTVIDVVT
jgi:hypothetical protein